MPSISKGESPRAVERAARRQVRRNGAVQFVRSAHRSIVKVVVTDDEVLETLLAPPC